MVKTFNQNLLKQELADLFKLVEVKLINEKLINFGFDDEILANKIGLQITDSDLIHEQIASQSSDLADYIRTSIDLFNSILIDFYFSHSDNKPVIKEMSYYINNLLYSMKIN